MMEVPLANVLLVQSIVKAALLTLLFAILARMAQDLFAMKMAKKQDVVQYALITVMIVTLIQVIARNASMVSAMQMMKMASIKINVFVVRLQIVIIAKATQQFALNADLALELHAMTKARI